MLNDAKVSHTEVRAFGGEPCRLFQSALHTVFTVFYSVFPVTLMRAGLPYMGTSVHAHRPCLPPSCSAQTPLRSALCFRDYCQHFVRDGSLTGAQCGHTHEGRGRSN